MCANDAKVVAMHLVRRPHFVYVFMSRADQGWLPLTVFASFEGVAPAVLPNLYSTVSGRLCICVCLGHPGDVNGTIITQLKFQGQDTYGISLGRVDTLIHESIYDAYRGLT